MRQLRGRLLALALVLAAAACTRSGDVPAAENNTANNTANNATNNAANNAASAAHTAQPSTTNAAPAKKATMALDLDWNMSVQGKQLTISYTLTNNTNATIFALDQLLAGKGIDANAIIVHDAGTPNTVAFTRGMVETASKNLTSFLPAARGIEPGKSIAGKAVVPLPLRAWHNFGMMAPLTQPLKSAVLQIEYIMDPGPQGWEHGTTQDGAKFTYPSGQGYASHEMLRTPAKRLPF